VTRKNLILAAGLALAATAAGAQTVWRCGNSYSTQPCAGGTSFEAPPAPGKAEAARAEKAVLVDEKRAAVLEKARLAQERNAPRAIVITPVEAPKAEPEKKGKEKGKGKGSGKPETFTASVPGPGKKAK
jgi:hypothetical protein